MNGGFLYASTIGVMAGIAAALLFNTGIAALLILLTLAVASVVVSIARRDPKLFFITVAICAAILGVVRTQFYFQNQAARDLTGYSGEHASVVGVVTNDPERRESNLHVNIEVQKINDAATQGTVLAILNRDEKVAYGDTVEVSGVLATPEAFETNTGHMFDYAGYLQVQGVSVILQKGQLVSDKPSGFTVQGSLFNLKHVFEASVERLFPEPENALLEGVLLGERRGIPDDLNQAFVSSGLVHVVVLSGYNISIVAAGVFEILRFLPRTLSLAGGGVIMILFALMTGAGATTIRALMMALISLLAKYMGRSAVALRSLAAAGAAMALWNPFALLHDPSFILSMLATFGLITLSPWVENKLPKFLLKVPTVRGIVGSTIAVQIYVLPALLYFTGVFSLLSVPANVLALPVVSLAMLGGFVAGLLGLIHPALAFAPTVFADVLLKWMILVAETTRSIPLSVLIIPQFSGWIVGALYIPLTWFALQKSKATTKK